MYARFVLKFHLNPSVKKMKMSKSSHNENMRGDAESTENSPLFLIEAE